jgi:hypothetical protein
MELRSRNSPKASLDGEWRLRVERQGFGQGGEDTLLPGWRDAEVHNLLLWS